MKNLNLITRLNTALEHVKANRPHLLSLLLSEIDAELNPDRIAIYWHVTEVLSQVPRLTPPQALEVLKAAQSKHDPIHGICWDTFETIADNLFPQPNRIDLMPKVTLRGHGIMTLCQAAIGIPPEDEEMTAEEEKSDLYVYHYFATLAELEALTLPDSKAIPGFTITEWKLSS